jgi:hypothetical protein
MNRVIDFKVVQNALRSSGGAFHRNRKGALSRSTLDDEDIPPLEVYSCMLRVAEDTFEFELFNDINPFMSALRAAIESALTEEVGNGRIDIPDHDVDLAIYRAGKDEFHLCIMHGDRVFSQLLTDERALRESLHFVP